MTEARRDKGARDGGATRHGGCVTEARRDAWRRRHGKGDAVKAARDEGAGGRVHVGEKGRSAMEKKKKKKRTSVVNKRVMTPLAVCQREGGPLYL